MSRSIEPASPGLTSIVIVTHNQLAYTQACVGSIRRHTPEPLELIFVDNGSTDGTVEYLRTVGEALAGNQPGNPSPPAPLPEGERGADTCVRVTVAVNAGNRGYPAAANQGIRAASGRQILLLNNDTIVTTGWLGRMLRALDSDQAIGLVGPCSNFVSGPQQIGVLVQIEAWKPDSPHPSPLPEGEGTAESALCSPLPLGEGPGVRGVDDPKSQTNLDAKANPPHPSPLPEGEGTAESINAQLSTLNNFTNTQLSTLNQFAMDWGEANDSRIEAVDRLVGFCMLIRCEVIERIGVLDERFGIGNFEDDDYCLRARQAGYRCVIARDAFVHHFGGATFRGSGVDHGALMRENALLYREKWALPKEGERRREGAGERGSRGEQQIRESRPPLCVSPSPSLPCSPAPLLVDEELSGASVRTALAERIASDAHPLALSCCMIVRDNERTIRPAIESIRPFVDEMVVVDTGSTDRTLEIAAELGARVFQFPWVDDFSAARNESIRHALGRWVFWLDSDDTIDAENARKLRELVERLDGCRPHPQPLSQRGRGAEEPVLGFLMQVHDPVSSDNGEAFVAVDQVKLFRNLPAVRFEGRIHEQILLPIRRLGGTVAWTDIFVRHSGSDKSPEGQARKLQRDLRLLQLELQDRPEHPFVLFNLGMTYESAGDFDRAADYLRKSIARSGPDESHLRKCYALLVQSERSRGQIELAWAVCQQGLCLFPTDPELRFRSGVLLHQVGRLPEAAETFESLLAENGRAEPRHLSSIDAGIRGYRARQNLAAIYADLERLSVHASTTSGRPAL